LLASSERTQFEKNVEKVCLVAIVGFAAVTNIQLFTGFFVAAMTARIYEHYTKNNTYNNRERNGGSCGQIVELLTRVRIPYIYSLLGSVSLWIAHMEHHEWVCVPITAVTVGWAAGDYLISILPAKTEAVVS
jgi:hypothetical protein